MRYGKFIGCGLLALANLSMCGCRESVSQNPEPAAPAAGAASAGPAFDATQAAPGAVVEMFLQSMRSGHDETAKELLTSVALRETERVGLRVRMPGNQGADAQYQVGEVKMITADGAHVASTWTEPQAGGGVQTFEIMWVMRREAQGWRVAGMAASVNPAERPLFLNFEDPEDMLRKWGVADTELAANPTGEIRR